MTDNNNHGSLAEALAALQGELPTINKNKTGKISGTSKASGRDFNYEYKYADLADVMEAVGPLMSKHGLSFSSKPTNTEHGFTLMYALRHNMGEMDEGEWPLPDPRTNDAKQVGAAITYARRYVSTAMLGIVTEEDTDIQGVPEPAARQAPAKKATVKKAAPKPPEDTEDKQRKKYHVLREQLGWDEDAGHDFINDLSQGRATRWTELTTAVQRGAVLDAMQDQVDELNKVGHAFPVEDEPDER